MNCKLCSTPIRKQTGDEFKPDNLACWIHTTGFYQCPSSRSEYDLATPDLSPQSKARHEPVMVPELDGSGI
jgi:hypothetical protein